MSAPAAAAVHDDYERRRAAHHALAAAGDARARRLSRARLAIFVAGAAAALWGATERPTRTAALAVAGVAAVAFTLVARRHRRIRRAAAHEAARASVCAEGAARVQRRWEWLPVTPAPAPAADHPYAADLSVVGAASLLQLFGPLGAGTGAPVVAGWLLAPSKPDAVRDRQDAVRALSARTELREELATRSRVAGGAPRRHVERFLAWCAEEPWLSRRSGLRAAAILVPALTVGAVVGVALHWLPDAALWLPVIAGLAVTSVSGEARRRLARAAPGSDTFRVHVEQFELVLAADVPVPAWQRVRAALATGGRPAPVALRRLQRLLDAAELRHSSMLHVVVNTLTAWDLHVLAALEQWRRDAGAPAQWFAALGEAEALCGLATALHDNPRWCLPELVTDGAPPRVEAEALAHPLLAPSHAVANDVVVGPPGTVLLVTGSNMAGKSTLLRAVAANAVLAQAGAPACARRLRLPSLAVHTSMRVSDSLEAGVSLFLAELLRLRQIVDAARAWRPGQPAVLYALDEILHGTNTAERQVAARRILGHLLAHGAIGLVSTHDLALANTPELRAAAVPVHFREELDSGDGVAAMRFDYVLRPGLATSSNALKLMELMGLG